MDYRPGDTVYALFPTQNPTTGAATNADSTPTGVLNRNGTDDGSVTVTVTNLATGRYKAVFTIPATYIPGDVLNLNISAAVSSISGNATVWATRVGWGFVSSGTAAAGGASTITLQTALGADHDSRRATIAIVSGTGAGQARNIADYVNGTKVLTVDRAWTVQPDSTSVYVIFYTDNAAVDASGDVAFNNAGVATTANQTSILNAVNSITTNTARTGITVPQFVPLPASGSTTVLIKATLFNLQGQLEDADSNTVTIHAALANGTSEDSNLSSTTMTRDSAGQYHVTYTLSSGAPEGGLYLAVTYNVNSVPMAANATFSVAQADTVTSIASILAAIQNGTYGLSALHAQIGSPMQSGNVTVGGYAANEDPWSIWKGATPSSGASAGTNEWRMLLLDADLYTDETTDPTQWHTVYIVRGSGAPGTGVTLMTKKLFDTGGSKVTANTQVLGQASQ